MRNLLFVLFALMATMPALAQDVMERTAIPDIEIVEGPGSYAVMVTGNGTLHITIKTADEVVMLEDQAENNYYYEIVRPEQESYTVIVEATATEEGKLESDKASVTQRIHGYTLMPEPEVVFEDYGDGVLINVYGPRVDVSIAINGNSVFHDTFYDFFSYFVYKEYEDQVITVTATGIGGDEFGWLPNTVETTYVLAAMEWPLAEPPEIYVLEDENGVLVHAQSNYTTHLFLDGNEVENPYYAIRSSEDQVLDFSAYCEGSAEEYLQPSPWVTKTVFVPALEPEPPMEQTIAPTMSYTILENEATAIVEITPQEYNCTIYYRWSIDNDGGFNFTDWMEYDYPLSLSGIGHYRVEAYAIAPGKASSYDVAVEFYIVPPVTKLYDFEEDGIFYLITGDGKVSVSCETMDFNTYSGDIVIPTTVTHEGVTYMVTGIGDNAFRNCTGLTGVTIGAYVTAIGNNAFQGCTALASVTLGDYVITLGEKAFAGCTALATVKMGSGLNYVGAYAFMDCNALTAISCKAATPPRMGGRDCFECYNTATLSVYPAVLDSYQNAYYWNQFTTIVGQDTVAPAVGDINGDGNLNIADITLLINQLINSH